MGTGTARCASSVSAVAMRVSTAADWRLVDDGPGDDRPRRLASRERQRDLRPRPLLGGAARFKSIDLHRLYPLWARATFHPTDIGRGHWRLTAAAAGLVAAFLVVPGAPDMS
jgi:hypothetical protein